MILIFEDYAGERKNYHISKYIGFISLRLTLERVCKKSLEHFTLKATMLW